MIETQVLIVGAGPVGLTLAIDLGRKGVPCTLIERNDKPSGLPKMERCNARTMEIYRRIGIAETVRRAGFPRDMPMDVFLVRTLVEPPLLRFAYPSVAELKAQIAATNDGTMPLEPYQLISQYTLEPLLKSMAEAIPDVAVRFGCELLEFTEEPDGVVADVRFSNGASEKIRARYLVGCDGGSSTVRKQLGYKLEGEANLLNLRQALFRCDDLFERIKTGRGRHYHRVDARSTFMIVQDDTRHFTLHSVVDRDEDMPEMFRTIAGMPIDFETLYVGSWTQHLLLSEQFSHGRVFVAGDAVHLVIPTGGLGMNTGVGEAIDLSWKLAATLQGWGGPKLLESYESERHPVGASNVAASTFASRGRRAWRAAYRPEMWDDTPEGHAAHADFLRIAEDEGGKATGMIGAELGYRYLDSPIICNEAGVPPPYDFRKYTPTTWPGARLPHVWLEPGVSVHDRIRGAGFTLLRLGGGSDGVDALAHAFAAFGAPFETIALDSAAARAVYGYDFLLLRPDLHVAWRGNRLPENPDLVAARVTGH